MEFTSVGEHPHSFMRYGWDVFLFMAAQSQQAYEEPEHFLWQCAAEAVGIGRLARMRIWWLYKHERIRYSCSAVANAEKEKIRVSHFLQRATRELWTDLWRSQGKYLCARAYRICGSMSQPEQANAENGHLHEAKDLFDEMPQRDMVCWSVLLFAYARKGHLEEAKHIFDEMPQQDLVSWTAMLSVCSQNGHLKEGKQMFDEMPQRDLVSWTALLAMYAHNGHLEEAKQMFKELPQLDFVSCTAMLAAYAQNGYLEMAKNMFDEMPQRDLVSWNAMVSAYAQNGHMEEAKHMFDEMPQVDMGSLTAMLAAYAVNGYVDQAKHLFNQMPQKNLVFWDAMLSAYAQNGHLQKSRKMLGIVSFSAMLAAYAHNGHSSDAFDVFDAMKMIDMPDEICFVSALIACNHEGKVYTAKCCFVCMSLDYGLEPTKQHYCCMVDLLGRSGYVHDAEDLIASMPFVPDVLEWMCLLGACISHNEAEARARAAKCVLGLDSKHGAAYVLLANNILRNAVNLDDCTHGLCQRQEKFVMA